MVFLYDNAYFNKIKSLKVKLLIGFIVSLIIALLVVATIIVINSMEPVNSPKTPILRIILIVFICIYVFCIYIYLDIVYGRVNKYFDELCRIFTHVKKESIVTFIRFNHTKYDINKVSFYTMEVLEWSEKKKDYVERNVYIDGEILLDGFTSGEILQISTVSNILFAYKKEAINETKSNWRKI